MNSLTYAMHDNSSLLSHGPAVPAWLHDIEAGRDLTEDDALVASGDYFLVLISRLDMLAQSAPQDSAEQIELENLIASLFYLQKHYRIEPKHRRPMV